MVSPEILASLLGIVGSLIIGMVVGVAGYLLKDKMENIEDSIDEIKKDVEERKREERRRHAIMVGWLTRVTMALRKNGFEIDKPDEVDEIIEVDE